MDPEEVPIRLHLEVIELQASSVCKTKHRKSSLLDFCRYLNSHKYKNLVQLAKITLNIFYSTYICEQTFSIIMMNKNKQGFLSNESQ